MVVELGSACRDVRVPVHELVLLVLGDEHHELRLPGRHGNLPETGGRWADLDGFEVVAAVGEREEGIAI